MLKNLLRYDFHSGMEKSCYRFFVFLISMSFCVLSFFLNAHQFSEATGVSTAPTFADCIVYLFIGPTSPIFDTVRVSLPRAWMLFYLIVSYLIGDYVDRDLHGAGRIILLVSSSREQWWLSKSLWCIGSVLLMFGTVYLIVGIGCVFCGVFSFSISEQLICSLLGWEIHLPMPLFLLHFLILPFLTATALSTVQMVLSLVVKPIFSFLTVATYYIFSLFFISPFFVANYAIPTHCSTFIQGGINPFQGVPILVFVIVFSWISGRFILIKKDMLG